MEKLLVICGSTATGKTFLALHLAKVFNGELISADSRQIYKGMDIGTGKDLPLNSNLQFPISDLKKLAIGCYEINNVRLWGYDIADPKQKFSVAHYISAAGKTIDNIWKRGRLPILVGGTGFYIKAFVDGVETLYVPQDNSLRGSLKNKSKDGLLDILKATDPLKAKYMNISDTQNPRRLIRAIEVAKYNKSSKNVLKMNNNIQFKGNNMEKTDTLFIGLLASREFINRRIDERVGERVKQGIEKEIKHLLKEGNSWNSQAMHSLGYRQWSKYFENFRASKCENSGAEKTGAVGDIKRQEVIEEWKKAEKNYAKRQMTWFKKDKRIKWFDISKRNWKKGVENVVREWHNR